jgi:hypothetical protein
VGLPVDDRRQVHSALRLLAAVEHELAEVDRCLTDIALAEERMLRLMTIPGVGIATAVTLVAVIGDISRFARPNELVGYLGLDPRVRQSGDRPAYTEHISRQGSGHARGLLVEAAHSAVRVPGPLRAFYQRVRARRGSQIAAVATARKLAVIVWHMLTASEDYRWQSPTRTATKFRRLELKFGFSAPSARGASVRPFMTRRDDAVLSQAEEAYRLLVASRHGKARAAPAPAPA